jgi:hypothetical protein
MRFAVAEARFGNQKERKYFSWRVGRCYQATARENVTENANVCVRDLQVVVKGDVYETIIKPLTNPSTVSSHF